MWRRILLTAILLTTFLLLGCERSSEERLVDTGIQLFDQTASDDAQVLTIVHHTEFKPYYYTVTKEEGASEVSGFFVEILRGAAEIAGIDIEFQHTPSWIRCLRLVEAGQVDAMFPLFSTKEREESMVFHEKAVLANEVNVLVSLKEANLVFDGDLSALERSIIGVIEEYSYGEQFDTATLRKATTMTEADLLRLLLTRNRYDFIVGNRDVLRYMAQAAGTMELLQFHSYELSNDPLYIGFSKKSLDRKVIEDFAEAISRFKRSARYKLLLENFNAGILEGKVDE